MNKIGLIFALIVCSFYLQAQLPINNNCLLNPVSGPKISPNDETDAKSMSQLKIVRVNFHFMLKSDGTGNFNEVTDGDGRLKNGYLMAQEFINWINGFCNSNEALSIPIGNSIQVLNKNYKFILDAVYFDRDNNYYNYGPYPQNIYGKNNMNVMNIYMQHSLDIPGGNASDISTNPGSKFTHIRSFWPGYVSQMASTNNYVDFQYAIAKTITHELTHLLTLNHTVLWGGGTPCPTNCGTTVANSNCDDGCADTPTANEIMLANSCAKHPHCGFNQSEVLYCSNNLMDYNGGISLTPCQLNKIHSGLEGGLKTYLTCEAVKTDLTLTSVGFPNMSYFGKKITVNPSTPIELVTNNKTEMYFSESVDFSNFSVRFGSSLDLIYETPCNY
jgi:hypothetical protein